MTQQRHPDIDVFETSSFASLIQQEELEEVIPLDLHTAALIGDFDLVRECINRKENIDKINKGGWTALMYAAYVGRDNILNMLLEAGAKVDIPAKRNGLTALMLASYCASESIMYFLLQHGAAINARDSLGLTSLSHAVRQGHHSAVKLLAASRADLDLGNYHTGITPLMEAAMAGHEIIFSILLEHGANIQLRTKKGENVRDLAVMYGNLAIVTLIDKATTSANSRNSLREEPKLINPNHLGSSGSSDVANLNDGPIQISKLIQQTQISSPPSSMLGYPGSNRSSSSTVHFVNDTTDPNSLQMSGISTSSTSSSTNNSAGVSPTDLNSMTDQRFQPKKASRVASTPPANVFSSQSSEDLSDFTITVKGILEKDKLEGYLPKFESQGIDLTSFLELNETDLKELGVDKLGPRKKILIAIGKCKQRLKIPEANLHSPQLEQLQTDIADHKAKLQQAAAFISQLKNQILHDQHFHSSYVEAEHHRRRQIIFYNNDVGKSCQEALGQLQKIKEYDEKVRIFLQKLQSHPNHVNILNELSVDTSIFEQESSIKREIDMLCNRLELTFKQVESALAIAKLEIHSSN